MTWIKLDDKAPRHYKIAALTDRAFRWWINGLCYASEFLTNGILHPTFWKNVPKQSRAELTGQRLWEWDDPNFLIHDYLGHQSSKESVTQKRADSAERVARYRERKRNSVTGNDGNAPVTSPETDTENREQRQTTATPSRPLVSGEANPRTWGKIHGEHVTGFCDWVCLPEFIFAEFARKSGHADKPDGGVAYVRGWAALVRERWAGPVGDNLKFWRARWDESHPQITNGAPIKDRTAHLARLAAIERGEIKR